MNDDGEQQIRQVVAYIAAAFPNPAWEIQTLRLYASELGDLNPRVLQLAAREWVQTCSDRPSVSDLRTAAKNMATRLRTQARRARRQLIDRQNPPQLEDVDPEEVRQLLSDTIQRLSRKGEPR